MDMVVATVAIVERQVTVDRVAHRVTVVGRTVRQATEAEVVAMHLVVAGGIRVAEAEGTPAVGAGDIPEDSARSKV